MTSSGELSRLIALVAEFEKLDASIPNAVTDGNWKILGQTLAIKKDVKRIMAEHRPLQVDSGLGLKLKKIRDNYGYIIDRVVKALEEDTGTKFSQESEEEIDIVNALLEQGTIEYVDEGFFRRRNQVGTLIVSESLPDHLVHHFHNLRECYALGLFEATVIYCRAIIETGCFEALRRRGEVKLGSTIEDIREFKLRALMLSIKPFVYRGNWDNANKVIKKADEVLHSKRKREGLTEQQTYDVIKDTFAIIEELFTGSHQKTRKNVGT